MSHVPLRSHGCAVRGDEVSQRGAEVGEEGIAVDEENPILGEFGEEWMTIWNGMTHV